jgi:pSer/pThr/pTyr-binding forkhead associated (FHA) protein
MAFVTIRISEQKGHERVVLDKDLMVLGRSHLADIPIRHTSISREHCQFTRMQGKWYVEDLGSANGTQVGSETLIGRRELAERDIVRVGKVRLTFHGGDLDKQREVERQKSEGGTAAKIRDPNRPIEAMLCTHCGMWLSIAHRLAGDTMTCARCLHGNTIPEDA